MGEVQVFKGAGQCKFEKANDAWTIRTGNGWHTAYAKLQKVTVKQGEKVKAGERVGLLGHTGETSDTALHFELRRYNLPLDPELVLPDRP